MRLWSIATVALLGFLSMSLDMSGVPPQLPPQVSTCVTDPDTTELYLPFLEDILTDPDSIDQEYADSLGIGNVSPRQVQLITEESECLAARKNVVEWVANEALPNARVILIDVGGVVRAVVTENMLFGEYAMLFIYDPTNWQVLLTFAF